MLLYGLPILAILLLLPKGQVTGLTGFLAAIKSVFTVYGGHIAANGTPVLTGAGKALGYVIAVAFVLALLTSGTTWIMGADRAQAMAALDGAAPRFLGRFSARFGTPIAVNICSGIAATAVMVLAFAITGGNALKYFTVVLGLVISTTTISYIVIFPALIKLRRSHPHVDRPYRVPGGMPMVWIVGGLCTFWAVLASIVLIYPGFGTNWFGQHGNPDSSLPAGFTRGQFELSQIIPLAILLVIGILFYVAGAPTRRHAVHGSDRSGDGDRQPGAVVPAAGGTAADTISDPGLGLDGWPQGCALVVSWCGAGAAPPSAADHGREKGFQPAG